MNREGMIDVKCDAKRFLQDRIKLVEDLGKNTTLPMDVEYYGQEAEWFRDLLRQETAEE